MIRLTHVITGLDTGGAENMLARLALATDRAAFSGEVISLTDVGVVGARIRDGGIAVSALGMRRGVPDPRGIARLAAHLARRRPDVVQTWMYHADLVGGLAARAVGIGAVAWGIRHSTHDATHTKASSLRVVDACARLSHLVPARIVCNSEVARRVHIARGFAATRMVVIPNGFDLGRLRPDAAARRAVRDELRVPDGAPLVGLIGRYDPQKDHRGFVEAAAAVPEAHFLLAGEGVRADNAELMGWIAQAGQAARFHLLGRRDDVPRLQAALDLAVSASAYGEAFPNVVGEAMACGVPCVVTDVGDAAAIVGPTGLVVPPRDPRALAAAMRAMLALSKEARAARGEAARRRIEDEYSLPGVAARFAALWESLARGGRR